MKVGISSMGMYGLRHWEKIIETNINVGDELEVMVIDPQKSFYPDVDFVIFDGGSDVSPQLYGEDTKPHTYTNPRRDLVEQMIYSQYRYVDETKFIGICRGQQLLNVLYGGTLYQDLVIEGCAHASFHEVVKLENQSKLSTIIDDPVFMVNSYHHQAVNKVGENLIPTIIDGDYGVIEGIESLEGDKIRAVQSHPETWKSTVFDRSVDLMQYLFRVDSGEENGN